MRMLLFLVALVAAAPGPSPAQCRPQASVAGEPELVEAVIKELAAGGLVFTRGESGPECFALRVRVERRGSAVLLIGSEPSGVAMEREASSAAAAATVIEAWALRGSGRAGADFVPDLPIIRPFTVRAALGTARSMEQQQFYHLIAGMSFASSTPFVMSLEGYFAYGEENFTHANPQLNDLALLFTGGYEVRYGAFTAAPELALGAGIGIKRNNPNAVVQGGLRERIAARLSYDLTRTTRAEAVIFALLMPDPLRFTGSPDLAHLIGLDGGVLSFGLSLGLRYSP